jgi:Tfp pilus assembly protein PilN
MSNANLQRRDYNFFSIAVGSSRSSKKKTTVYIIFLLIYLLLTAGAYFAFEFVINTGKKQIDEYNAFLTSEETTAKRQQVREKKQEIDNLQKYTASLDAFIEQLKSQDTIGTEYIQLITSAIPENLYFENVSMTANQLQIQGNAPTRVIIAEFLNNMQALEIFQDVHISAINTVAEETGSGQGTPTQPAQGTSQQAQEAASSYTFTMSCQLKEVISE